MPHQSFPFLKIIIFAPSSDGFSLAGETHGLRQRGNNKRRTHRKTTLEISRQAPQKHWCRRVQARCFGLDLPQVHSVWTKSRFTNFEDTPSRRKM